MNYNQQKKKTPASIHAYRMGFVHTKLVDKVLLPFIESRATNSDEASTAREVVTRAAESDAARVLCFGGTFSRVQASQTCVNRKRKE